MASHPEELAALAAARASVLERIARACARARRDPAEVELVAVSKTVDLDRLRAAVAAGLTTLGENRVQEALPKIEGLPDARWHLIGPLQSNKVRRAASAFGCIQSVHSVALAERLDRVVREDAPGTRLRVLLQANVDDDPAKAGFGPDTLRRELPRILDLPALDVRGLMTVGRLVDDAEAARPTFVALHRLGEELRSIDGRLGVALSMGMSDDFEVAIEEGATIVRVGRALFGERPHANDGGATHVHAAGVPGHG